MQDSKSQTLIATGHAPAEGQLADYLAYGAALESWFYGFLSQWTGPAVTGKEAIE
jgi:hypothetical protein